MSDIVGLTGLAGLEAEMRDRLKAKDAEIERLRALVLETGGKTEKEREAAIVEACATIAKDEFKERGWHQYYQEAGRAIARSIRAHGIARVNDTAALSSSSGE